MCVVGGDTCQVQRLWRERKQQTFTSPPGLDVLKQKHHQDFEPQVDATLIWAVLEQVREGACADAIVRATGLSVEQVRYVVTRVGSRLGRQEQGRVGRKIRVARAGVGRAYHERGVCVVHLPQSWGPAEVGRSYAAVYLAPESTIHDRVEDWVRERERSSLGYYHFVNLRAAAEGKLPSLGLLGLRTPEASTYVTAFQLIQDKVHKTGEGFSKFVCGGAPAVDVADVRFDGGWLLGELAESLWPGTSPDEVEWVRAELAARITAAPEVYFPRSLAEINVFHFENLVTHLGYSLGDSDEDVVVRPPYGRIAGILKNSIAEHGVEAYQRLGVPVPVGM